MTDFDEPPFEVHELDRTPADLTDRKSTAALIAGISFGSFLVAAAIFYLMR